MELGCGCRNGMALPYCFLFIKKKSKKDMRIRAYYIYYALIRISFFVLRLVILPQPGLGRIAEQVQVLVA